MVPASSTPALYCMLLMSPLRSTNAPLPVASSTVTAQATAAVKTNTEIAKTTQPGFLMIRPSLLCVSLNVYAGRRDWQSRYRQFGLGRCRTFDVGSLSSPHRPPPEDVPFWGPMTHYRQPAVRSLLRQLPQPLAAQQLNNIAICPQRHGSGLLDLGLAASDFSSPLYRQNG